MNDAHEAVVALSLQGPAGQAQNIEAVIDTGYSGFLTLSDTSVTELGLPFAHVGRALLVNDDEHSLQIEVNRGGRVVIEAMT